MPGAVDDYEDKAVLQQYLDEHNIENRLNDVRRPALSLPRACP